MTAVPEIRFPEFDGEWQRKRVGEIATFQRGFDLPYQDRRDGQIPVVSSGGITGVHDEAMVKRPGIVTGRYGSIGQLFYLKEPHWPLNTALWVKDFHGNSVDFAYYHLSRIDFKKLSDKTGVPGINRNDLHRLWASTTTLPEQRKIAAFLGAVDEKIDVLRRKHESLKQFKAGLMQKLFSQELRFKRDDGSDFPDWEEKRLGDVANIIGGGTPESGRADYWSGDIEWFTPSEVGAKFVSHSLRRITDEGLRRSSAKLLPVGALLLCTRATVGRVSIAEKACTTNQGFQSLVVKKNHINSFWYYWVLGHQKAFLRRASGSTFLEIGKSEVGKIPVQSPQPEEQQKIADCLSAVDAKIEAVDGQIAQLEAFKKGLLQKMFV